MHHLCDGPATGGHGTAAPRLLHQIDYRVLRVGALVAGAQTTGEALGAPYFGSRFDRRSDASELRLTLLVSVALLGAMTTPAAHAPLVLAGLAALYGAVSSGIPGALRAALVSAVPQDLRAAALGLETALNQSVWAVGPLIASWLSSAAPVGIILTMAASCLIPVACARRLPQRALRRTAGPGDDTHRPRQVSSFIRALLLPLGIGVASNFVISAAEVSAPARLTELNIEAGFAGVCWRDSRWAACSAASSTGT
ncbi:MFS transporter [Streptomyces sp. NPDC002134]|uniref:MFS transporter n=1 Tax=Streptomyces sp. NPDC002134 TaxID=3364632 RepID=UPI003699375A